MATVITSIGSKSEHTSPVNAQITVSGSSGSGTPWSGTVTYTGSDPTVSVGDILHYKDVYYNCDGYSSCADGPLEVDYLITAINTSTNTLTVRHIRGGTADSVDPFANLDSDEVGTTAQPYIVRCFSTVALWEADLDTDVFYDSDDIAKGEMYPDSTFSTNFGQVGGGSTVGLLCKVLTAAEDHRHDGAESGSHVKVTQTSKITHAGAPLIMSWLDISGSDTDNQFIDGFDFAVTHCIIHDVTMSGYGGGWPGSRCVTTGIICNNIIYNIDSTTYSSSGTGYYTYLYGIWQRGTHFLCDNNTVYKVHSTNSWGGGQFAKGIVKDQSSGTAGSSVRNNIVVGTATDTEGTNGANAKDFNDPTATFTNNISSDDTADGSNSITGESAADLFVSNSGGSEDLHLKAGAAAIGAGADLGTTYSTTAGDANIEAGWDMGPQFDIDNRDRDAEEDTWDIGADQFVASAATGSPAFWLFFD